ncbi:MAG: helix-turn-helix transcriptional regulator [Bacilli bacterium]|nr:helix-turn-helix transcriptional regulator [Bacilli bacterium]
MNKLKELRIKNKLTIEKMAKLVNISYTYYWQIENNKRNLYYSMAIKISKVFNLKPDDIFY